MKIMSIGGKVLYEDQADNIKATLEAAAKARANLADAYLADANLARANLAGAYLAGANLARANLAGAYLAGANLAGANLAGANLADAYLADANLAGANLADAYLADAYLADANLARANLAGANLADAYLAGANLAGANLADAYLADANLARANLAGANLADANLESNTTIDTGEKWDDYLAKVVPALCTAGGKPLELVAAAWDCHEWKNCPMAVAFDVDGPNDCPPLLRHRVGQFVRLFDARLIPNPLGEKAGTTCPATAKAAGAAQ